jgi:hypothetical protein
MTKDGNSGFLRERQGWVCFAMKKGEQPFPAVPPLRDRDERASPEVGIFWKNNLGKITLTAEVPFFILSNSFYNHPTFGRAQR